MNAEFAFIDENKFVFDEIKCCLTRHCEQNFAKNRYHLRTLPMAQNDNRTLFSAFSQKNAKKFYYHKLEFQNSKI